MKNNCNYQRNKLLQSITGLLFLFLFTLSSTAHAKPKKFPVPDWLHATMIADEMLINGLPSRVQHFETNQRISVLLNFYRKQWKKHRTDEHAYKETQAGPWYIISKFDGQYLYTVQVRQESSFTCRGYLAVADMKRMKNGKKNLDSIPQMQGSKIINDVSSFDNGMRGRTLMLTNGYSSKSNSNFYRSYYSSRGWATIMDTSHNNGFVLSFEKDNKETHLVINHLGGASQIIMNNTEKN